MTTWSGAKPFLTWSLARAKLNWTINLHAHQITCLLRHPGRTFDFCPHQLLDFWRNCGCPVSSNTLYISFLNWQRSLWQLYEGASCVRPNLEPWSSTSTHGVKLASFDQWELKALSTSQCSWGVSLFVPVRSGHLCRAVCVGQWRKKGFSYALQCSSCQRELRGKNLIWGVWRQRR